jgi:hypothetical protein
MIDTLRHQTYHVTGLKVYDYRTGKTQARADMAAKVALLETAAGDRSLFVPEAPELGGYGHLIDNTLMNVDTLKFWEVMIALNKGAVLDSLTAKPRAMVCEIGAGWGGFARVMKTIVPNTTYIIIDLPQTMLFSGTYLKTLFPDAKVTFHGLGTKPNNDSLAEVDFYLVPHFAIPDLADLRPDLTLNMVSFQEMTADQVAAYVDMAWTMESPFLYSLNRDRSPYNPEMTSVSELISQAYHPHELSIVDLPYTKMVDTKPKKDKRGKKGKKSGRAGALTGPEPVGKPFKSLSYKHIIGWRKPDR